MADKSGGMKPPIKELEEENRHLKKMYLKEKLMAEITSEAIEKNGEAVSKIEVGQKSSHVSVRLYHFTTSLPLAKGEEKPTKLMCLTAMTAQT